MSVPFSTRNRALRLRLIRHFHKRKAP
jgi:hypothetical protein